MSLPPNQSQVEMIESTWDECSSPKPHRVPTEIHSWAAKVFLSMSLLYPRTRAQTWGVPNGLCQNSHVHNMKAWRDIHSKQCLQRQVQLPPFNVCRGSRCLPGLANKETNLQLQLHNRQDQEQPCCPAIVLRSLLFYFFYSIIQVTAFRHFHTLASAQMRIWVSASTWVRNWRSQPSYFGIFWGMVNVKSWLP